MKKGEAVEKKKMGRPTDNPKTNAYRIRMTDDDLERLNTCCQKTGMSKADIFRLGLYKVYKEVTE